jgi:hypothetical protein
MKEIFIARKAIGRVFGDLGRFQPGDEDRPLDQIERPVQPPQHIGRPLAGSAVLDADHHPVRPHEVADGRALAQEFRVGRHDDVDVRPRRLDALLDLPPGADRHGGLRHQHQRPGGRPRHLLGRLVDEAEVGMAVAPAGRRAHREEHRIRARHRAPDVGGEGQPPLGRVVATSLSSPGS